MARKGPSPMKQKMAAYRRRPYTDAQRMNYQRCECDPITIPPQATLDAAAEFAMTGGWNTRKSNICDDCRQTRSVNGACGCN